jgi:hypothetical protein
MAEEASIDSLLDWPPHPPGKLSRCVTPRSGFVPKTYLDLSDGMHCTMSFCDARPTQSWSIGSRMRPSKPNLDISMSVAEILVPLSVGQELLVA